MNQSKISLLIIIYSLLPVFLIAQSKSDILIDTIKTEIRAFDGSVKKELSIASVSTVHSEDFREINTPNLGNTLAGKLTGLHVSQTGSAPGYQDWPWLLIRGKASFLGDDGSSIKVVVDGFETKWHNILPEEIESVSVLKDAPAVLPYGMSGANGVLYIKTKRGAKRDRNRIVLNSRLSLQQPTILPKFISNGEYATIYNQALINDDKDVSSGMFGNENVVNYFLDGSYPYLFSNVNWIDEVVAPHTFAHDYSLSVNGGNDAVKYNVVLGYMNTQGIYAGTDSKQNINSNWDLKRYTVRTNIDVQIAKFLRSEVSLRATIDDKHRPNVDEATLWKNMGVFIPFSAKTETGEWGGSQNYPENPVASVQAKGYNSDNDRTIDANIRFVGDLGALTKGLEAFGQVVFSNNYYSSYNKTRNYAYLEHITTVDPFGFVDYTSVARGDNDNNFTINQPSGVQWNRYNFLTGLTYENSFNNKHNIYASTMYLQELYRTDGSTIPYAKMGVTGRFNYNYDEKYIAELGYTVMGTAEYSKDSRFGLFPSISAAWILSKEEFLKDNSAIDFLKLATSYGISGNDRMGGGSRFTFRQYYIGSGIPYYLGNGFSNTIWTKKQGSVANPDVTWEKSHKFNISLSSQLYRHINFNIEYFNDYRTDIFVAPSNYMSALIGADYYNQNAGIARNQGFETELSYSNNINDFNYFINGRFSYAKNKIIDMKEAPQAEDYLYMRGNVIDQPMVLEAIGFFQDMDDIQNSPLQMFGSVVPGDVKYKDQNGDGFIDDNDRKPIGNPVYPRFYYGLDIGAQWKGFDLLVFVQGVGGRTVSLLGSGFLTPFVNGGVKPHPELLTGYWTAERGNDARYPRLTTEANNNNYRSSTLWQIDGSYLRIKNIELGYTFKANLIQGISGIRLYVNTVNPFTFSKLNQYDLDPEINSPFKYPLMKSMNFGLSLQF